MNQPVPNATGERERKERNTVYSNRPSPVIELDMKKYAPFLQQAGIPSEMQEQYLRELAGMVASILDTYFEDLKGNIRNR